MNGYTNKFRKREQIRKVPKINVEEIRKIKMSLDKCYRKIHRKLLKNSG